MFSPTDDLFARALGLESPWTVIKTTFSESDKELHIYIDFKRGGRFTCPQCQAAEMSVHDTVEKKWRHLNFFQHKAFLHCRVPRVKCDSCGVHLVEVPWSHSGSGFTLMFEAFILALASEMPVSAISRLINEHDTKIWRIVHHYVNDARSKESYAKISRIGVDETACKRGHNYVSIFADIDKRKVLFATPGKDHTTVSAFKKDLTIHGGCSDSITDVCCDMSPAFIKGIEDNFPKASITFDRFHVMKIINKAVDEVRRIESWECKELKNSRYLWLKNPDNLNINQKERFDALSKMNLKTAKAWRIRESLRDFWNQPEEDAEKYLKKWYFWATHCRIYAIKNAAYTIKKHWEGIINYSKSKISNGILEGINSKVQAAKSKAKGYRSEKYFITIIYLIAGKLKFSLPT